MKKLNFIEVAKYVEKNIGDFHNRKIQKMESINLSDILVKKNPYLFKAKNILIAEEIIKKLLEASISSSEETMFGNWLEEFAIFINAQVYGGRKSSTEGIDLEFDVDNIRYIVAIKSGPNWGNSSQIKKMKNDFKNAGKTLRTSNSKLHIIAINGCCYGRDLNPDKGEYFKFCGQKFWEFLSGDKYLYTEIIEPLGYKAKERNDEFMTAYSQVVNKFTKNFVNIFCDDNGKIDWEKMVRYNSENKEIKIIKKELGF